METTKTTPPILTRRELEDTWRIRLEQAMSRYRAANQEYRALLESSPEGRPTSPESPLAQARQAESDALAEYTRVLRIFSDLTIYGKLTGLWPDGVPTPNIEPKSRAAAAHLVSIVDQDEVFRESTRVLLNSTGYRVETFASGYLFLTSTVLRETVCVVLELDCPGIDGLTIQRHLSACDAGIAVVFIAACDDRERRQLAMDCGAVDFLYHPLDPKTPVSAIETGVRYYQARRRIA